MYIEIGGSEVNNSRFFKGQNTVWRRRRTPDGTVFTTRERIDLTIYKVAKAGSRPKEPYQPAKLLNSLLLTLSHLSGGPKAAWSLLETVETQLTTCLPDITSKDIAKTTLAALKNFDIGAYQAYGRYHPKLIKG